MTQRTFAYVYVLPHGDTPGNHDEDPETVDGPFTGSPREVIAELETSGTAGQADFSGVREHLAASLDLRPDLPRHVAEAFEAFLDCGILAHGFARLRCVGCGHERLLPFSCKGRLCPSCSGRRMYDTAAHLVDRVLPVAGYRQWVLSRPRRVRYLLVTRPELVAPVLGVFQRVIFTWQRRRARRAGVPRPLPGSITCIQRFGDALNLNLHSRLPFSRRRGGDC